MCILDWVSLHQYLEVDGGVPLDRNLPGFDIGHEKIEPKINLYSSEDNNIEVFTYVFRGKDIVLYLNYGVTDNASDYDSEMIISVDGEEVKTCFADKENRDPILET